MMFKIVKDKKTGKFSKVSGPQEITPALMELIPQSLLFYNIVWLAEPATKRGLLDLPIEGILATVDNTHHGILVRLGALAYAAETPGLHYADDKNAPAVGEWVVMGKHCGQRRSILLDRDGGWKDPMNLVHIATVTDTDIQEKATEEQVKRIRGWL